jgi:hypothetical protein
MTGAWTTVIFSTEQLDELGEYNSATGLFTASSPGIYSVAWNILAGSAVWSAGDVFTSICSIDGDRGVATPTSAYLGHREQVVTGFTGYLNSGGATIVKLAANQTIDIAGNAAPTSRPLIASTNWNHLSIMRIQ